MNELVGSFEERARTRRRTWRSGRILAIETIGPLTMLGGLVWGVAQPYRVVFVHPEGKGIYDWLVQPPLLVVLVGLLFALFVAPGLVEDLERSADEATAADGSTG